MKLGLYAVLLCAVICGNANAGGDFVINIIDFSHYGLAKAAIDINNRPIVVHSQFPWDSLRLLAESDHYAAKFIPNTYGAGWPSLAMTSNNEIALTYTDWMNQAIRYGSKAAWYDWAFSEAFPIDSSAAMALDCRDIPHIVHASQTAVMHSWFDVHSNQWLSEPLSGFGPLNPISVPSIDISSDGRILVSYWISGTNQTQIAVGTTETGFAYLPVIEGRNPSPRFTADGLPAVAFERNLILYYAVYTDEIIGWVETSIASFDNPNTAEKTISLAQSSAGMPAIAYIDGQKLMYATNIAGGWTTNLIDEHGYYPDLIFDHQDKPLITYGSSSEFASNDVLKLAGIRLEPFHIADLDHDKNVNFFDFAILAGNWIQESEPQQPLPGDFNIDNKVESKDLRIFASQWLAGATPFDGNNLIFIHHSVGLDWLNNGLDAALVNKEYIDKRNYISYGSELQQDSNRPNSLGAIAGNYTDMNHWIFWFNDYLGAVKNYGCSAGVNRIIMFKSSFENSNIANVNGEPGSPFSGERNLANYRAVYRHPLGTGHIYDHNGVTYKPLEDIFAENPDTLFITVTAPPISYGSDGITRWDGNCARAFNEWLKSVWLAAYNEAHPGLNNVAVFDFFDLLAYPDNHALYPNLLKEEYGGATVDSHPNAAADQYATQVFAAEPNNFIDNAWNRFTGNN